MFDTTILICEKEKNYNKQPPTETFIFKTSFKVYHTVSRYTKQFDVLCVPFQMKDVRATPLKRALRIERAYLCFELERTHCYNSNDEEYKEVILECINEENKQEWLDIIQEGINKMNPDVFVRPVSSPVSRKMTV